MSTSQDSNILYNKDILRLAVTISREGSLENPQVRVEKHSPICGSRITVFLDLDAQGRVCRFAQEVRSCALGQASASILGDRVMAHSVQELSRVRDGLAHYLGGQTTLPPWPELAVLAPARPYRARHGSILLPFQAVVEAGEILLKDQDTSTAKHIR